MKNIDKQIKMGCVCDITLCTGLKIVFNICFPVGEGNVIVIRQSSALSITTHITATKTKQYASIPHATTRGTRIASCV
jgi:hypothetical protein